MQKLDPPLLVPSGQNICAPGYFISILLKYLDPQEQNFAKYLDHLEIFYLPVVLHCFEGDNIFHLKYLILLAISWLSEHVMNILDPMQLLFMHALACIEHTELDQERL